MEIQSGKKATLKLVMIAEVRGVNFSEFVSIGHDRLHTLVFRLEPYSVRSGNIVWIRVIRFKLT